MYREVLQSDAIQLRPVRKSDAQSIFLLYSDPDVCRYLDILPFENEDQAYNKVLHWQKGRENGRQFRYVIEQSGEFCGTLGLYSIYRHQNRASIGYDLLPRFHNRGIMTRSLNLFLEACFRAWDFNRIQALVMDENPASKKLLKKLGFQNEGLLKQYEKWPGKSYVDLHVYAQLKEGWEEKNNGKESFPD
jgi:ribosomal-protein-alanine N-acetyltransferase